MLPLIFGIPIIQLVILVHAATLEMKSIDMLVVDQDMSSMSRELVSKFEGSPFYNIGGRTFSLTEAMDEMEYNRADIILNIPVDFERKMIRENSSQLQLLIDGINGTVASLTNVYSSSVIVDFNKDIVVEMTKMPQVADMEPISIQQSFWY